MYKVVLALALLVFFIFSIFKGLQVFLLTVSEAWATLVLTILATWIHFTCRGACGRSCQAREASALRWCGVWQRAREGHTQTTQRACSERALSEFACDRQRCNSQTSLAIGVKIACHR